MAKGRVKAEHSALKEISHKIRDKYSYILSKNEKNNDFLSSMSVNIAACLYRASYKPFLKL